MNGFIAVLKELGPIITAATPVLLILVSWWTTKRQTKDLKAHSDENMTKIQTTVSETGTHKALGDS